MVSPEPKHYEQARATTFIALGAITTPEQASPLVRLLREQSRQAPNITFVSLDAPPAITTPAQAGPVVRALLQHEARFKVGPPLLADESLNDLRALGLDDQTMFDTQTDDSAVFARYHKLFGLCRVSYDALSASKDSLRRIARCGASGMIPVGLLLPTGQDRVKTILETIKRTVSVLGERARFVCTPLDIKAIKCHFPQVELTACDVWSAGVASRNNQHNPISPREAILYGADFVIIGPQVTAAERVEMAYCDVIAEIAQALADREAGAA